MFNALFLDHPHSTKNPQGYFKHGLFSVANSLLLMFYCVLGVIHGLVPGLFPFSTSSAIIRSFCKLVASERHQEELRNLMPMVVVEELQRALLHK
jgi:hypothetical protein